MLPRLLGLREAAAYLNMGRHSFDRIARPYLTEIRDPEARAVRFDRLDLDAFVELYKTRCGRPPREQPTWQNEERQGSSNAAGSGTRTSKSTGGGSLKALAKQTARERSST